MTELFEQMLSRAQVYGQSAFEYLSSTAVLVQLGLIFVLFVIAHMIDRRVEPVLREKARDIKGMPGLLRILVSFLKKFEWLFFAGFLAATYVATSVLAWPDSNYLIYVAMLLSATWLLISVASHALRSQLLRTLFSYLAWGYVAATILGVTDDVASMLDSAGFSVGDVRFSILSVAQALFLLALVMWGSNSAGNFLDRRIQNVDELTPSLRVLLGKIVRITLLVLAALVAMSGLGIDLTALTVLSGAVGVGIGFGLQKVVSNFISGIIILVDQSIKPGDTISLGETFGWIRELRARFVSVVTRDGREFLIPNEDFITREVINWSFSDKYVRLDVPFGVSYNSNPHDVIRIAKEAAVAADHRVDGTHNPPVCWMTEFGDSSLNFKLRFWIDDPQQGLTNIRGKVLLSLWDKFKENDIAIPYPHREVYVHNAPDGLLPAADKGTS
ncbi:MAG: mechanosensitive ion channel domain-containing protein [Pseudomonadota bacterium]